MWSTNTVAALNLALLGIPFNCHNKPGVLDSNWSTDTQSPGTVMTILIALGMALVRHGRRVMPNIHAWHTGTLHLSILDGNIPFEAICWIECIEMWPNRSCHHWRRRRFFISFSSLSFLGVTLAWISTSVGSSKRCVCGVRPFDPSLLD
jgi:hypothetical protein